jgi:hypothetical protein
MKFWSNNNGKITGVKDIDATLDFPIDFADWLVNTPDDYASHTITSTGGIEIVSCQNRQGQALRKKDNVMVIAPNSIITPIISGGTLNELASFTIQITTASGRIDERTFYLRILNR